MARGKDDRFFDDNAFVSVSTLFWFFKSMEDFMYLS